MEKIKIERKKKRDNKNFLKCFFGVLFAIIIIVSLIVDFYFIYIRTTPLTNIFRIIYDTIKIALVIYILLRKDSATYKLSWIIIVAVIPVFGLVMYQVFGKSVISKKRIEEIKNIISKSDEYLKEDYELIEEIEDVQKKKEFNYIYNMTGYPIYENQGVKYLKTGEEFFDDFIQNLKNATKYIFIDLYIISKGDLLDKILDILYKKSAEGVIIKIIVDDLGSKTKKPKKLEKSLKDHGIEILFFNNSIFSVPKYMAYRDHRKIIIIDGKMAYTGGINIADEYINVDEKYGYWKDGGIKVFGTSCISYIVMFGRLYEQITNQSFEYYKYIKEVKTEGKRDGLISCVEIPPENNKNVAENIYMNAVSSAKKNIYIVTPYLIPPEPLLSALSNAARSNIDVKIIVPMTPDKVMINKATKSFYTVCLEAGIEIYEYNPGFIHSKLFLSDDNFSIVGSINIDYRSFNLNYECTTITYKTGEELAIKKDIKEILDNSTRLNLNAHIKRPFTEKIYEAVSRLFTPII